MMSLQTSNSHSQLQKPQSDTTTKRETNWIKHAHPNTITYARHGVNTTIEVLGGGNNDRRKTAASLQSSEKCTPNFFKFKLAASHIIRVFLRVSAFTVGHQVNSVWIFKKRSDWMKMRTQFKDLFGLFLFHTQHNNVV